MLNSEEKRSLEIYTFLIIAEIRKNNPRALLHLRQFFKSTSYFRNYDPDLLYNTCIKYIERSNLLPSSIEMALLFNIKSDILKFSKVHIRKLYHKDIPKLGIRKNMFSENPIKLMPKIRVPNFHENLLIFYKNFAILNKSNPIK